MLDYSRTKVYSDGSHYIGIPSCLQPKRKKRPNKKLTSNESEQNNSEPPLEELSKLDDTNPTPKKGKVSATVDIKQIFENLYNENIGLKKNEKVATIRNGLKSYFDNPESLEDFLNVNLERKKRNAIERRKRLSRKVHLQQWNYFCTFTYDDKIHSEESFKKAFETCIRHLANRKGWKYVGVWERSPEQQRLHFHSLMYIPEMVGTFEQRKDYSTKTHKMQIANQNTFFLTRFGRNDFKPIEKHSLGDAIKYITKYIEKTHEKLVYSRNLPMYFISDILPDDVACPYGVDDRKLLLFDNMSCLKDGEFMGIVSPEVIDKMEKCN